MREAVLILEFTAGLGIGLAWIGYLLLAVWRVGTYAAAAVAPSVPMRPVTVLKPLCGADPGLLECLRSFCQQDYREFQIVFGVRDPNDTAIAVVQAVMREFPEHDLSLVVDLRVHGTNLKVSNLINLYPSAKHDIIVVSDSDVLVGPDCLRKTLAPLADPRVGAVTCPFRATPIGGFASCLAALFIDEWLLASALVDARLRGVNYCSGPVTAIRRSVLEAVGGFERLSSLLADDFLLGREITRAGFLVKLSDCIVETVVSESLPTLWYRELRWARTDRITKLRDHILSVITHPLPLLLVLFLPSQSELGGTVIAAGLLLRAMLHFLIRRHLSAATSCRLWLIPVRELLCFVIWSASFLSNRINWRNCLFEVSRSGVLVPLAGAPAVPAKRLAEMT